jgi:hypothetical protein
MRESARRMASASFVFSMLADWIGRAAFVLRPVHERLLT